MHSQNSTNVRVDWGGELSAELVALHALPPETAAVAAAELFLTAPVRRRVAADEQAIFARADSCEVQFDGERLPVFRFGTGPAVLLLHGWGGSSAQLHVFVGPLLARGASVVAFDAPGHGAATGSWLAIPRYAEAIVRVVEETGPVHGVIAHSMGGAAAAFATSVGFEPARLVLIGPPASEFAMFQTWVAGLGFDTALIERAALRVEERVGVPFERLRAEALAASVTAPLLVIHDRHDREVPWADGAAIARAARDGRLMSTEGLGHRRILRDTRVVDVSSAFAVSTRGGLGAHEPLNLGTD